MFFLILFLILERSNRTYAIFLAIQRQFADAYMPKIKQSNISIKKKTHKFNSVWRSAFDFSKLGILEHAL